MTGGRRGAFILFEGCDRSGKSTQAAKLVDYLQAQGHSVRSWKFPERTTPIGQMIDAYLRNTKDLDDRAVHLLFSANRWECISAMKNLLLSGTSLVVDRYAYSGVAYSVAKGLDLQWCKYPDIGLLTPDVVLYMDFTTDEAANRTGFGEERYERYDLQKKARNVFHKLHEPNWKIFDARQSVGKLHDQIAKVSTEIVERCASLPLREDLWKVSL